MNPLDVFRRHWTDAESIDELGEGHINRTWRVDAGRERFVLQQINRHVFRDPERVMMNLGVVLAHVKDVPLPLLVRTRDGASHVIDDGEWYRVWRFVEGGVAKKQPAHLDEAQAAADAFGRLQASLRDLPQVLSPSIPGFHRLARFHARLLDLDPAPEHASLIADCLERSRLLATDTGAVHGDCKFENVMLSEDGSRVLAILDLDTLMQGHWGFDWGDLVRSAFVNSGAPEEQLFRALLRGFLPHLESPDPEVFVFAPMYVACTLGVRYLIDHLEGDVWFRVQKHGDNLVKARRQFRFVERCEAMQPELRRWVDAEGARQA